MSKSIWPFIAPGGGVGGGGFSSGGAGSFLVDPAVDWLLGEDVIGLDEGPDPSGWSKITSSDPSILSSPYLLNGSVVCDFSSSGSTYIVNQPSYFGGMALPTPLGVGDCFGVVFNFCGEVNSGGIPYMGASFSGGAGISSAPIGVIAQIGNPNYLLGAQNSSPCAGYAQLLRSSSSFPTTRLLSTSGLKASFLFGEGGEAPGKVRASKQQFVDTKQGFPWGGALSASTLTSPVYMKFKRTSSTHMDIRASWPGFLPCWEGYESFQVSDTNQHFILGVSSERSGASGNFQVGSNKTFLYVMYYRFWSES